MKYTLAKLAVVVVCSFFMIVGACVFIQGVRLGGDSFAMLMGAVFFLAGAGALIYRLRQIARFQKMTYQWYCQTHPELVRNNKVSCYSCGNAHIQVRALYNQTYHRAHLCSQCGTTLYYSPE